MAISPIGNAQRFWAQGPTEAAREPEGLRGALAAGRTGGPSQAPPKGWELKNVAEVLLKIAGEQGLVGAPGVSDSDILRVVKLDRALQAAKENNMAKAGPAWTGDIGKLGPRIANMQMNDLAYGLKVDLVRAATRFEAAERGYLKVEPYASRHPDLLSTGVARNALEVGVLKAVHEFLAASEQLEHVGVQIDSMIQRLSPKP